MNKILLYILGVWILMLCAKCKSDTVTIPKAEYNQLKGITPTPPPEYPKLIHFNDGHGWERKSEIIIIDSCEYISFMLGSYYGELTHKGNCKFCQHRLEETIRKIIREELQKK